MIQAIGHFCSENGKVHLGLIEQNCVYDLSTSGLGQFDSLESFISSGYASELPTVLRTLDHASLDCKLLSDISLSFATGYKGLLAPVDQQEIWGTGMTYAWTEAELQKAKKERPLYASVYESDRPMLFYKSPSYMVSGTQDWIGMRSDAQRTIPEAELAILINRWGEIVGYGLGNDVTALVHHGINKSFVV